MKLPSHPSVYDVAHLAMTYTALMNLVILGDDLSQVNQSAVLSAMRRLQTSSGRYDSSLRLPLIVGYSFVPFLGSNEADMRFLYCACAISYTLKDWSAMDLDLACDYIRSSIVGSLCAIRNQTHRM